MSNFCCLPGIAGGLPGFIQRRPILTVGHVDTEGRVGRGAVLRHGRPGPFGGAKVDAAMRTNADRAFHNVTHHKPFRRDREAPTLTVYHMIVALPDVNSIAS